MPRQLLLSTLLLTICFAAKGVCQHAPSEPEPPAKGYATYDELFGDFEKQREVLFTRMDRLREQETAKPEEMQAIESELRKLDGRYADALDTYIQGHPAAKDLMPARFELAVALSRIDDKLERAILAADDFLKNHADAELAPDVRFLKGQTMFRLEGREKDALAALDEFIEKHPERQEADSARMMRVRTLLFLDRPAEARRTLETLLKSGRVKNDEDAEQFLRNQLENLDWIGKRLPAFKLADLAGQVRSDTDYEGKPTLVFVWDSNSTACLGELPFVQEAFKRHKDKLNFLGISVNESKPALEQWLARNPEAVSFSTVWIDRDEENSLVKKLSVTLIPFLVLVDSDGKIFRYDVRSDDMLRYTAMLAK